MLIKFRQTNLASSLEQGFGSKDLNIIRFTGKLAQSCSLNPVILFTSNIFLVLESLPSFFNYTPIVVISSVGSEMFWRFVE